MGNSVTIGRLQTGEVLRVRKPLRSPALQFRVLLLGGEEYFTESISIMPDQVVVLRVGVRLYQTTLYLRGT